MMFDHSYEALTSAKNFVEEARNTENMTIRLHNIREAQVQAQKAFDNLLYDEELIMKSLKKLNK